MESHSRIFVLLAGNDNFVNRMVIRFVEEALRVPNVESRIAGKLIIEAADALRREVPSLTATQLDYEIWQYQRRSIGENGP